MDAIDHKIQTCEAIIGYTFRDKRLASEALQTSGIGTVPKNTRLAVYGDVALNMALCRLWYPAGLDKGACSILLPFRLLV